MVVVPAVYEANAKCLPGLSLDDRLVLAVYLRDRRAKGRVKGMDGRMGKKGGRKDGRTNGGTDAREQIEGW